MKQLSSHSKIAFCFSWQARTLDQTYLFFQRNLFDAAKEQWFDYDVFCAVEDDEDADKVKLLNPTRVKKIKSSDVDKLIKEKYWKFLDENYLKKYMFATKSGRTTHDYIYSILQQFYKISESIWIEKYYREEKKLRYEIVVRLRYDCVLLRKLNYKEILKTVRKWILICNESYFKNSLFDYRIINDFYFIWNSTNFDTIWKIFYDFEELLKWKELKHKKIIQFIDGCKNTITKINNMLWTWVIPVLPITFIWYLFYKKISAESLYYKFFIKEWISVCLEKFSFFLLKSNFCDSIFSVEKPNVYEKF